MSTPIGLGVHNEKTILIWGVGAGTPVHVVGGLGVRGACAAA